MARVSLYSSDWAASQLALSIRDCGLQLNLSPQLNDRPKWPQLTTDSHKDDTMRSMSAKDAKYGFGRLIDLARAEPVVVEKHGRPVVVVLAIEEYERLRDGSSYGAVQKPRLPTRVANQGRPERA